MEDYLYYKFLIYLTGPPMFADSVSRKPPLKWASQLEKIEFSPYTLSGL